MNCGWYLSHFFSISQEEYKFSGQEMATSTLNALNVSIEVQSINNDYQHHQSNVSVHSDDSEEIVSIPKIDPIPSTIVTNTVDTNDTVVKSLSDDSIGKEPNTHDQQKHQSDVVEALAITDKPETTTVPALCNANSFVDKNASKNTIRKQKREKRTEKCYLIVAANGRRRYKCNECDRSSYRWDKLQLHIRAAHEGIRNYACEECDKRFVTLYDLKLHAHTHTGKST